MWPFEKRQKMTVEEYAATRPEAPCGNQKEHVYWTEFQSTACPVCAAKAELERKEQKENRLAEKIAAAVVRHLNTTNA